MVDKVGPTSDGKPIVAHCSAGLGRTGVFVTVHSRLECHRDKRRVDVEQCVSQLREQRSGMIQSEEQYRFCFEAIAEALSPGKLHRTGSEPARRAPLGRAAERRMTVPPPGADSPRTRQRKKYLQDNLPPPPSFPPPDDSDDDAKKEKQTTPKKAAASPPPPSTSPPPPLSEPATPIKAALPPDVVVTPPPLDEEDVRLIERKMQSMAAEQKASTAAKEATKKTWQPKTSAPKALKKALPKQPKKDIYPLTKSATKSTEPPKKARKTEPKPPVREPPKPMDPEPPPKEQEEEKEDLGERFSGFEMPASQQDQAAEEEEEEEGFNIDQTPLTFVAKVKPVKKEEKKPVGSYNAPSWRTTKASAAPKMEKKTPPARAKVPIPVVNREEEGVVPKSVRAVGKLVMPTAFGGGGASVETTPPKTSPKPPRATEQPAKETPKPSPATKQQPPSPSPPSQPPPAGTTISFEKDKREKASSSSSSSQGGGRSVLSMIRNLETKSPSASPKPSPSHVASSVAVKPPPSPRTEPARSYKIPDKATVQREPRDSGSGSAGNVGSLLARFQ